MRIVKHVVSLEMAKKLKDHFKDSLFVYNKNDIRMDGSHPIMTRPFSKGDYIPAPLATELLERLPKTIHSDDENRDYDLTVKPYDDKCYVFYSERLFHTIGYNWSEKSLPDALAEMFLKLVEAGIIKGV